VLARPPPGNVVLARQAVRKLVPERLVFAPIMTPEGERVFEFRGEGRLDPILAGLLSGLVKNQSRKAVVTPAGSAAWCGFQLAGEAVA